MTNFSARLVLNAAGLDGGRVCRVPWSGRHHWRPPRPLSTLRIHRLLGGGGVDGAIHRAGGPRCSRNASALFVRSDACLRGERYVTNGGKSDGKVCDPHGGSDLPRRRHGEAESGDLLSRIASAWPMSIQPFRSLPFPSISTGISDIPLGKAAIHCRCNCS